MRHLSEQTCSQDCNAAPGASFRGRLASAAVAVCRLPVHSSGERVRQLSHLSLVLDDSLEYRWSDHGTVPLARSMNPGVKSFGDRHRG